MLPGSVGRALWAGGLIGHVVLLGVLVWRRHVTSFPFFSSLIGASVLRTALLFLLRGSDRLYLFAFLAASVLDAVLQFCIIYEVASAVFRPLGRWAPDARRSMAWLILGSIVLALALTWLAAPAAANQRILLLSKVDFLLSILFSELFLGMVMLSVTVGLPWKTHVSSIAYGLGAYSILDIAIEAGHALYGPTDRLVLDQVLTVVRQVSYLACLVYWIATFWRPEPETRQMAEEMQQKLHILQQRLAYDLKTLRHRRRP